VDPAGGQGRATFTYTVRDGDGTVSAPATVTVVGPRFNRAPEADDQVVEIPINTTFALALAVRDGNGDPLTVVDVVDPAGVETATAGTTMQLLAPAPGTYAVSYRVTDGELVSRTATVTVIAAAPPPTTAPPTTVPAAPPPAGTP
jgi:hypothetical protein